VFFFLREQNLFNNANEFSHMNNTIKYIRMFAIENNT